MYHKHEIVAKIGTILSFFFVGFGFIEKLLKDKKWVFYNNGKFYFYVEWNYLLYAIIGIIFCGIFWSLRYCWKYYKSDDISIFFYSINSKDNVECVVCNNTEHDIIIDEIRFIDKGETEYRKITNNVFCIKYRQSYAYEVNIGMINNAFFCNMVILYRFSNTEFHLIHNKKIKRTLSKKEIKMFKKLSQK
jgi:hypothetical protein